MASIAKLATIPVESVAGLAGKRGDALRKAGIATVADLLHHVPRRYVDRSRIEPLAQLPLGDEVTVIGEVSSISTRRPRRGLTITEARIKDATGSIKAVWFNQQFRQRQLSKGAEVALSGKVERFRGTLQMSSPDVDVLSGTSEALTTGRVVPVHRGLGGVGPGHLRRAVHNALRRSRPIPDPIPEPVRARHGLVDRSVAYDDIHFPDSSDVIAPARRRLVFDELFRLELALALARRRQVDVTMGIVHEPPGVLVDRFLSALSFRLTSSQRRVMDEIGRDLESERPMHRLLQGEVGSGKTVVAVATLLRAVEGDRQGAVMAPTEVLATQHYLGIRQMLEAAGLTPSPRMAGSELGMRSLFDDASERPVSVALLTSSQVENTLAPEASRPELLRLIAAGEIDLVIGTHALIQEGVAFASLGIAVVDEQHRFGAIQRMQLKDKATDAEPDLLIMTATPIPRTLAMTLYGDLDVSTLDELPPGRSPITTVAFAWESERRAWDLVRGQVRDGRQAFVVCPLVEESAKIEAASATTESERLAGLLPDARIGLLHGQLPARDKERVMAEFREGAIDVLVATTVIEVGIDVPNATVMVIEDADRFGLSQLHQLRGRVGRGIHAATCVLLADPSTPDGERRIEAMTETGDGFRLAEIDLELRGQGTVFGARQSGMGDLRIADIVKDFDELTQARTEAFALVADDPELARHPDLAEETRLLLGESVAWLFVS